MSSSSNSKVIGIVLVPIALAFCVASGHAGNVGVDVNIHLGNQPQQVVVPAPPVQEFFIDDDIDFVYPARLGFYVAVGVPYDIFYLHNSYYLCRDGRWYRSHRSHGPWYTVRHRDLPPGLRRHKVERIRAYRDAEHDTYRRDRDHYHGKHFRSRKDQVQEERRDEHDHRKAMKREEKERRRDNEDRQDHRGRRQDRD